MSKVVKSLIVPSEAEPGLSKTSAGGAFKVAECATRIVLDMFWIGAAGCKSSAEIGGLCRDDTGLSGGELEDGGDGGLDEVCEEGVGDDGGTHWWVGGGRGRGVLGDVLVDEDEDVTTPGKTEDRIVGRVLYGGEGGM